MSDFKPDIWRLQAQFDTRGLVDALVNEDAGIRRRAAAALRALGAVDAIPNLEAALEKESDSETRSNILSALAGLQQEVERRQEQSGDAPDKPLVSEIDQLIHKLRNSDTDEEVIEAAKALGEKGEKVSVVPLVMLFNDPKTPIKVRLSVAEALLKLESAPVEVALLGALRNDTWRIRRNAAAILGQLRAEWAVEPLSKILDDPHDLTQKTASAALRNIGTPDALEALRVHREQQKQKEDEEAAKAKAEENKDFAEEGEDTTGFEDDFDPTKAPTQPTRPLDIAAVIDGDLGATTVDTPKKDMPAMDETQKIVWPKRERKRKTTNPTLAPTKPLDPKTLEEFQKRNSNQGDTTESET